jgi:hypothetical protein
VTFHPTNPSSASSSAFYAPTGLTGATAASRYVGGTASGSPGSGTFAIGDYVIDQSGAIWVCTVAGSPGTWVKLGQLDATASDIQPVGTALAAGSTGKAADAGHVHTGLSLVASTGLSGVALVNGTPTILTWTTPNDGAMHRVVGIGEVVVSSTETGGQINIAFTDPGSNARSRTLASGGQAAGIVPVSFAGFTLAPNTTVNVIQVALTGGAAVLYVDLWGS